MNLGAIKSNVEDSKNERRTQKAHSVKIIKSRRFDLKVICVRSESKVDVRCTKHLRDDDSKRFSSILEINIVILKCKLQTGMRRLRSETTRLTHSKMECEE